MGRPKGIQQKTRFEVWVKPETAARLDKHLYSPAHGRVPYQARGKLVEALIEEHLKKVEAGEA
jgi:hypothetical protein